MKNRCKVCQFSEKNFCVVKQNGVSLNKPRRCDYFILDTDKVKVVPKIETKYVPYYLTSKKAYKKHVKEQVAIQQEFAKQSAVINGVSTSSNKDCLSRFRATALPE